MIKKYLIKRVRPYQTYSRYWGIAWFDYNRDEKILMPLGLNFIANWINECLYYLEYPTICKTKYELQEENIELKNKVRKLKNRIREMRLLYDQHTRLG